MSATTTTTDETDCTQVSDHAVLRWLQRVDESERQPRDAIRRAWDRGQRTAVTHGTARLSGDAVLVRHGNTITTVLREASR